MVAADPRPLVRHRPGDFLLACILLLIVVLALTVALLSWNPWLLLFAAVVLPLWLWLRIRV